MRETSPWLFHVGAEAEGLEPSSVSFPGHNQRAGLDVEQPGINPVLTWDAYTKGESLADYAMVPAWEFLYILMKQNFTLHLFRLEMSILFDVVIPREKI